MSIYGYIPKWKKRLDLRDKPVPEKKRPKPIRRRRPERAKDEALYHREMAAWVIGKSCVVYPDKYATGVHHKFGRRGRLLRWQDGWVPVSMEGHTKIETEKNWAREQGFTAPVGQFNNQKLVPLDYVP